MHYFLGVSLDTWLTILAVVVAMFTGPLAALVVEKYLEERRARKNRKILVFHALMANRASRLSAAWVQALNAIETEFYGEKKVIEAWRVVVDHLYSDAASDPAQVARWNDKQTDLINDMLFEMGESLGYHFDKVTLKRNAYYPKGWGEVEVEQAAVRKLFLEVLNGKRKLPVGVFAETFPGLADEKKDGPDSKK
jgi:hypothetical protein